VVVLYQLEVLYLEEQPDQVVVLDQLEVVVDQLEVV
jgi:hypothetical protein